MTEPAQALRDKRMPEDAPPSPGRALVVGIEAATPAAGVALADIDGRLLAHIWSETALPASRRLLAGLDLIVREHAVRPGEIRAVAVGHGPGAFTGLRVALAQAKTMAHAWSARLYGFSTLEATAARWPVAGDVVCVALDARRGEVYSGLYRIRAGDRPECLRPDAVEKAATLATTLREGDWPIVHLSGVGALRYREVLEPVLGARARWIPQPLAHPAADSLALAGARLLAADEPGLDPLAAGPVYLRVSDAEKRHGVDLSDQMPEPTRL
jgi:tRNA threonylcarbamoyladenosine biosynthesis protein TsaB